MGKLANRTSEAHEAVREADWLVARTGERWWYAELHRLRAVFLTAIGGEGSQIEASFSEAISTAKEQKSISLEKRAEATYAEYRRQKAGGSEGRKDVQSDCLSGNFWLFVRIPPPD
jgi:hypothetical protein